MKYLLLFFSILFVNYAIYAQDELIEKLKEFASKSESSTIQGLNPMLSGKSLFFQDGSAIKKITSTDTIAVRTTEFRKEVFAGVSNDSLYISIPASLGRSNIFLYLEKENDTIGYQKVSQMDFGSESSELDYSQGIFSSNRPGGTGKYDLYYYDGQVVQELPSLNSDDSELDPWRYKDYLFFTRIGKGLSKLYYSKKEDDSWSEPLQLDLTKDTVLSHLSFVTDDAGNIQSLVVQKDNTVIHYRKGFNLWDEGVTFVEVPKDEAEDSIPGDVFRALFFKTNESDSLHAVNEDVAKDMGLKINSKTFVLENPEILEKFKDNQKYSEVVEYLDDIIKDKKPTNSNIPRSYVSKSHDDVQQEIMCLQIGYYRNHKKFNQVIRKYLKKYPIWMQDDIAGFRYYYIVASDEQEGQVLQKEVERVFDLSGIKDAPFLTTVEKIKNKSEGEKEGKKYYYYYLCLDIWSVR